jgi:hypothetical protein
MILPVHEEHGEVLATWHRRNLAGATAVCFDRHLDIKALSPSGSERLAAAACDSDALSRLNRPVPFQEDTRYAYGLDNFVLAASRLGLLSRFVWVHPEPSPLDMGDLAAILWDRLSLVAGCGAGVIKSFAVHPAAAQASVGDLEVLITTPRRLAGLTIPPDAQLDIDLDFFATEQGKLLHQPTEVIGLIDEDWISSRSPTLTWSISSGFLPDGFEWIGAQIADGLGFEVAPRTRRSLAPRAMRLLSTVVPPTQQQVEQVINEELSILGGAGLSLAAVLALSGRPANRDAAIGLWERARAAGDGASWPAYSIALSFMQGGDYAAAADWFAHGEGERVDTIQLHGGCMRAVCLSRLGHWEEALALALALAEVVPMRREPWLIARSASVALGRTDMASRIATGMPQSPFRSGPLS